MCLYPKIIKNKKYTINKKNKGIIPDVKDERTLMVPIGCGKCIECKKQKKREWQVRVQEEIRENRNGKFVTMTFSNEAIDELMKSVEMNDLKKDIDNEMATLAVRRFLERWRKRTGKSVRHWLVTELGHNGTERIHLHGLIWTDDVEEIEKTWRYGHVWIGDYVNEKTVNYIVKYINKIDELHKGYNSKILCSKGIGCNYLVRNDSKMNSYNGEETREFYRCKDGTKLNLPTYYRNKIYSDEEREKLWLNMLDKDIRYVGGDTIDISINEDEYDKAVKWHRAKSKRMGYGDDSKEWSFEVYKESRDKLRALKRYNESKRK